MLASYAEKSLPGVLQAIAWFIFGKKGHRGCASRLWGLQKKNWTKPTAATGNSQWQFWTVCHLLLMQCALEALFILLSDMRRFSPQNYCLTNASKRKLLAQLTLKEVRKPSPVGGTSSGICFCNFVCTSSTAPTTDVLRAMPSNAMLRKKRYKVLI